MKIFLLSKLEEFLEPREAEQTARILLEDIIWEDDPSGTIHEKHILDVVGKLKSHVPIQYITGIQYFMGLKFKVSPSVLIPRPETEELCRIVLENNSKSPLSVVDIGTGSGCIPCSLKYKRPNWQLSAIDISKEALNTAKYNSENLKLDVEFHEIDILTINQTLLDQKFDIIVSNPPYISQSETNEMSQTALTFDPDIALFAALDGMAFYQHYALNAQNWLNEGGKLYLELNEFRTQQILDLFHPNKWKSIEIYNDMQGKPRILELIS